jgi:hemerythrin-like domain-containing protein
MKPTEELMKEHNAILTMLQILEAVCQKLEAGLDVSVADMENMLTFFKEFADGCHHRKEESLLFPQMEQAGIPRERGPIGVMLAEHDLGRKYIREMNDGLKSYKTAGDREGLRRFITSARAYANLLTLHIDKENNVLFPMADQCLDAKTQAFLSQGFETLEREEVGVGRHEEFHEMLRRMKQAYLAEMV